MMLVSSVCLVEHVVKIDAAYPDNSGPILFRNLMTDKSHYEVARMFAATLQMVSGHH